MTHAFCLVQRGRLLLHCVLVIENIFFVDVFCHLSFVQLLQFNAQKLCNQRDCHTEINGCLHAGGHRNSVTFSLPRSVVTVALMPRPHCPRVSSQGNSDWQERKFVQMKNISAKILQYLNKFLASLSG